MSAQDENQKIFDPRDNTLTFVDRVDDLEPVSSGGCARAQMSCGHAVTPDSLTGWCRSLLDQGQYIFRCPALQNDTMMQCNAVWPYKEVRRLALLTRQEMQDFEETMAHLAASQYSEFKTCPGCRTNVERKDLTNLNVLCTVCSADKGALYQFCWQCLRQWKGSAPRSDRCDNDDCTNEDLQLLRSCKDITLPQVRGVDRCPSIRACPTCGQRVEHDRSGCKNIICPRCQVEFCFVCLKRTSKCLKTSTHFISCSAGVAPRQTSIPVWRRHQGHRNPANTQQ